MICRNCHFEEHTDVDFFNKYKKEIYDKVINFKEVQKELPKEEIYKMYDNGMKQIEISKHFNASKGAISGILKLYKKKKYE